jgi:hypothetical protein
MERLYMRELDALVDVLEERAAQSRAAARSK